MVFIDYIYRFIGGVLGNNAYVADDSFFEVILDCPNYTSPKLLDNMEFTFVILSVNHI